MNTFHKICEQLQAIELCSAGNARVKALASANSPEMKYVLEQALSPYITFGLKQVPEPASVQPPLAEGEVFPRLQQLLAKLQCRELSGDRAKTEVASFLGSITPLEARWAARIIRQDLRLGLAASSVNKAFPGLVPVFKVPLATDYKKVKEKDLDGLWALQAKLDGARTTAFIGVDGSVTLRSRTGQVWGNFGSIATALTELASSYSWLKGRVLDGEVVSYTGDAIDFQALQKTMMRDDGIEVGELRYIVFDAATEDEWNKPYLDYRERIRVPGEVFSTTVKVQFIESKTVVNPTHGSLARCCRKFVEAGYEGAIVRALGVPVEMKRGKKLLKIKEFQDAEATVVDVVEGKGKFEGMLGALVCETETGARFEVGSGFTDSMRKDLWAKPPVGRLCTFKLFELTDDDIPRFPIFKGLRPAQDVG